MSANMRSASGITIFRKKGGLVMKPKKFLAALGGIVGLFTLCMMPVLITTIGGESDDASASQWALIVGIYLLSIGAAIGAPTYLIWVASSEKAKASN